MARRRADAPDVVRATFGQHGQSKDVVDALIGSLRAQWRSALDAQYYLFYACVRKTRVATLAWLSDVVRRRRRR